MRPPEFPPGVDPDAYTWHHAICPGCGLDWWHGSDPADDLSADDTAQLVALLGVCGDCRERRQPRAVRRARRSARR